MTENIEMNMTCRVNTNMLVSIPPLLLHQIYQPFLKWTWDSLFPSILSIYSVGETLSSHQNTCQNYKREITQICQKLLNHRMTTQYTVCVFKNLISLFLFNVSDLTSSSDKSIRSANVDRCVQRHSMYLCCDFSYRLVMSHSFSDQ